MSYLLMTPRTPQNSPQGSLYPEVGARRSIISDRLDGPPNSFERHEVAGFAVHRALGTDAGLLNDMAVPTFTGELLLTQSRLIVSGTTLTPAPWVRAEDHLSPTSEAVCSHLSAVLTANPDALLIGHIRMHWLIRVGFQVERTPPFDRLCTFAIRVAETPTDIATYTLAVGLPDGADVASLAYRVYQASIAYRLEHGHTDNPDQLRALRSVRRKSPERGHTVSYEFTESCVVSPPDAPGAS